ncbi:kinase-like domain-containing protein [Aspergillus floccosus]
MYKSSRSNLFLKPRNADVPSTVVPPFQRRWTPLNFSNPNFVRISASQAIEEETLPEYVALCYYPTRIGIILKDQYQVVCKLGFGASSTVWLARDMEYRRYVTLGIFIKSASMGRHLDDELDIYKRIGKASPRHASQKYVRSLLDSFDVDRPEDKHRCLADNIVFGIDDDSVFGDFEANELHNPCPRKEVEGRTIYFSREIPMPKRLGALVLCDFGSAVPGDQTHSEDIQPDIYRAPEVISEAAWSYSVDIWNVGCMIWNIFEGGSLFTSQDPEFQTYRSRAHLAEMISLLGPPSPGLLAQGDSARKFSSEEVPEHTPLEKRENSLEVEDKEKFLCLAR